jgi:peptidoglycan/xylan/chitin deacetylase (PgdA/CDA1 family)
MLQIRTRHIVKTLPAFLLLLAGSLPAQQQYYQQPTPRYTPMVRYTPRPTATPYNVRSTPVARQTSRATPRPTARVAKSTPRQTTAAGYGTSAIEQHENREAGVSATQKRSTTAAQTTGPKAIANWPTGRNLVALSYDDGPHPRITPQLLELLQRKNVKATFYLLGQMVKEYPKVARQVAEAGHEVAAHSYDHKQFTKLSESGLQRQLQLTHDLITSATGVAPTTLRPPYGATNSRVNAACEEMGYKVVLWDVDTNDWRKRTSQQMIAEILKTARDGSIILMHDRYQTTLDTTEAVIDALRAKGYEFVTVAELLSQPRVGQ